jgi:hypothetical protein
MVGEINSQRPTIEFAQDKKCVCMTFEKTSISSVTNSYSCKQSIKEVYK